MSARAENLQRRGYTSREAAFVELAALQSGYFVRRQFNEFVGGRCGAVAQAFIERAMSLGHVTGTKHLGGRVLYQFTSAAVFAALSDPNNRNRRLHQNETIRRRLMALDYSIARQAADFLLTEQEKIEFFTGAGVTDDKLPTDVFPGNTKRYFVDKQPVEKTFRLAFIDEGFAQLSAWEGYLLKHRGLLNQLPAAVTVFASPDERRFLQAERLFNKVITGSNSAGAIDGGRLRRYFEARKLFEAREFSSFTQARLDQFREDRAVFSGEEIETMYVNWREAGDEALRGISSRPACLEFQVLKHRYDWLSPIRKGIKDAADSSAREKGQRSHHGQAR